MLTIYSAPAIPPVLIVSPRLLFLSLARRKSVLCDREARKGRLRRTEHRTECAESVVVVY